MAYIHRIILIAIALVSIALGHAQSVKKSTKPNIVLLLVDDLGWRDVGFMGSKFYETPNIDKLSHEGMVFTKAYAACAVCSPTRAALLTGRYPARIGVTDWIRARFQTNSPEVKAPEPYEDNDDKKLRTPSNPYWMELNEVTIAELLKQSGYFTCHIGKWHLGPDDHYPETQGYDLNIAGNDMGQPVNYFDPYKDAKGVGFPNLPSRKEGEYLTDRLSSEVKTVINEHKDKPFFISMCYYAVHTPLMAKKDLIKKYEAKPVVDEQKNAVYAAMVESMDKAVGTLMNTLAENKLLENTIVIFTSDNGGLIGPTNNSPLRSGKGYPYEGGIRVPLVYSWKGKIFPNSSSDLPVSSVDFLPTICALTNTPLPSNKIDGRDISSNLFGKQLKEVPLYWHFPHYRTPDIVPYSIILDGDWKLIKQYDDKPFQLFNLRNDKSEQKDLSSENPGIVKKLNKKLEAWLKETNAKLPIPKAQQ